MHAENPRHLAEHAQRRHHETLHRAHQTLTELTDAGQPVTVALFAKRAGVSRSWIYTQPELRAKLCRLRQQHASAEFIRTAATRATDDSLRQRLALAHERISQLRTENQQLRDALAHAHGELRATGPTGNNQSL
jgi:hypothetical protein